MIEDRVHPLHQCSVHARRAETELRSWVVPSFSSSAVVVTMCTVFVLLLEFYLFVVLHYFLALLAPGSRGVCARARRAAPLRAPRAGPRGARAS